MTIEARYIIEAQIAEGRHSNASGVTRAGLRPLEEHKAKLAALRAALIEGEQSGQSLPFDIEKFVGRMRQETPSSAT